MDNLERKLVKKLNLTEDDFFFVFYVDRNTYSPVEYENENSLRVVFLNGETFFWNDLIKK